MEAHKNLIAALEYLSQVIQLRLRHYFEETKQEQFLKLPSFEFAKSEDPFTQFVVHCELTIEEFATLLLALAPHLRSNFFEGIVGQYIPANGDFPELGGVRGRDYRYMIPTIETALFILAGNDVNRRLELLGLFDSEHFLVQNKVLFIEEVSFGEPFSSRRILINPEYVELFTKGRISVPALSTRFPAQRLQTEQKWSDLILPDETFDQLREIELWVNYNEAIMCDWGMAKKLKLGYRALFYGPPGTGKTLAASLIGKATGREVFRVDLSKMVSKYIGETEKNLANFFDKAENKDWCIFFDEADACFGKRTMTKDAKDRYANQEVAYLLQRIEEYPGLIIMATNLKNNIDKAFIRRFNSIIYFPLPKAPERLKIWEQAFPRRIQIEPEVLLEKIAEDYELSGSNIMNAVQYACLRACDAGNDVITEEFILKGVHREYKKESRC